jgi:hypothetical protein
MWISPVCRLLIQPPAPSYHALICGGGHAAGHTHRAAGEPPAAAGEPPAAAAARAGEAKAKRTTTRHRKALSGMSYVALNKVDESVALGESVEVAPAAAGAVPAGAARESAGGEAAVGGHGMATEVLALASVGVVKLKARMLGRRFAKRVKEFKQREKDRLHRRHDGILWAITAFTMAMSLAMGVSMFYVSQRRMDWWGRGCLVHEVASRHDYDDENLAARRQRYLQSKCYTQLTKTNLRLHMWIVLGAGFLEAVANLMYLVVEDVDLNDWFQNNRSAFVILALAQIVRAVGRVIVFPECLLVAVALILAAFLLGQRDNMLAKTDYLVGAMVVWPLSLALQIFGWIGHYVPSPEHE